MSNYIAYYPSTKTPAPPENENNKIYLLPSSAPVNTETNDTNYSPFKSTDLSEYLHSQLQNPFYLALMEEVTNELNQLYEASASLYYIYDIKSYLGDIKEFFDRYLNILSLTNTPYISTINSVLNFNRYNEDYSLNTLENNDAIYFYAMLYAFNALKLKRYNGTIQGLRSIFSVFFRHGILGIRSIYATDEVFTPFTKKVFKLTDFFNTADTINSFDRVIPGTVISKFPYSVTIYGCEDYSFVRNVVINKYDQKHVYDKNIGTESVIRWDTGLNVSNIGKGMLLEITLDTTLTHYNTVKSYECLQDIMYLDFLKRLAYLVMPAKSNIFFGSQLTLVARNTGQYISDRTKQINNGVLYTHPNIKAKFQVIKEKWYHNNTVSYIVLGTGRLDDGTANVFVTDLENPDDPSFDKPIQVKEPIFSTRVSDYEIFSYNGYTVISAIINKVEFTNQLLINTPITIGQTDFVGDVPETIINFPHTFIAKGTAKFEINLTFKINDTTYRTRILYLEESFDMTIKDFIMKAVLLTENRQLAKDTIETYNGYGELLDPEYQEAKSAEYAELQPYPDGNMVKFDRIAGTLRFKLKCKTGSTVDTVPVYVGNSVLVINSDITCTYTTNSIKSLNPQEKNAQTQSVAITEIGVFNTNDEMVAYGVFPPIIYDSENYHISINCLLENPVT